GPQADIKRSVFAQALWQKEQYYGAVSNSGPNAESNRSSTTAFSSLSLASSAASRARAVSWAVRVVAGSFAEGSDKAFLKSAWARARSPIFSNVSARSV